MSTQDTSKPRVAIRAWTLYDTELMGDAINHPRLGYERVRTSLILKVDMDAKTVETRNTVYVLSGEGRDYRSGTAVPAERTLPAVGSRQSAFDALKQQLHDDPDMAWAWHCNIAMAVYDTTQPAVDHHNKHRFANEGAARTMSRIFDVDVTKFREWEGMKEGWVILDQQRGALRAPEEGEVWLHRKGDRYTVIGTTDAPDAEKADKFPRVVFYRGPDGRKWSRPLLSFLESFQNDFTRNVPECDGSHDDGQVAAGDAACTVCGSEDCDA
jgi:hypothetical protein